MKDIRVLQFARLLGSKTVSDMAQKVGLKLATPADFPQKCCAIGWNTLAAVQSSIAMGCRGNTRIVSS